MSEKRAAGFDDFMAQHPYLTQGIAGAGAYGLGQATNNPILGALGGGLLGNLGGTMTNNAVGGNENMQKVLGLGGMLAGGVGGYRQLANAQSRPAQEQKQAMLDDIYNMGLDAAIDQFTKSAGIKRRIGKTYRRVIGKPSMRDRVENGVDAVRDRVSGPINSAKNLGSSAVNAIKKTWNDYSNKGEE